jgi:hypothetical protein
MKTYRCLLLLGALLLFMGSSALPPVAALGVITLTPGTYQGSYQLTVSSQTFTNISVEEMTESQDFEYRLTAKGKLTVHVSAADQAVLFAHQPEEMSVHELHFFNLTSKKFNCHESGSMTAQAKASLLASLTNNYIPASESFRLPFSVSVVPKSPGGSGEKCKYPVSNETLWKWISNITAALNGKGQIEFGVFEAHPTGMGGAVWIPNWDVKSPIQFGSLVQTSDGYWYAHASHEKSEGWHK